MLTTCRCACKIRGFVTPVRALTTGTFDYRFRSNSLFKSKNPVIYSDGVLQTYIKNISLQTGKALGTTGIAATAGMVGIAVAPQLAFPLCMGGMALGLYSAFKFPDKEGLTVKIDEARGTIEESNSRERVGYANGIYIGMGLSMSHILTGAIAIAPSAIPLAGLLTAGTVGGMIHWAKKKPSGSLSKWGPTLHVGLWSLVGTNLGMLAYHLFVGGISPEIIFVENIVGVGLFSAYTAYDFNRIITEFTEEKKIDTLGNATHFHLNILNIFVRYLQMFMRNRD